MAFKIFTEDTHNIIYSSNIRSVENPDASNLRLNLFNGEESLTKLIRYESYNNQDQTMMIIIPEDMIGRTFLGQPRDDMQRNRARIIKAILEHNKKLESNPEHIKLVCSFNYDQYKYIYAYNDIIRRIEKDNNDPGAWKFKYITVHDRSLKRTHPNYK